MDPPFVTDALCQRRGRLTKGFKHVFPSVADSALVLNCASLDLERMAQEQVFRRLREDGLGKELLAVPRDALPIKHPLKIAHGPPAPVAGCALQVIAIVC